MITIEDAAELRLRQPHVVRLESRPANVEGRGRVTIRDLLRGALRMRPDRIVIGEVRGGEALDLLMALNTGHEGALSTVHANSPEDALRRIETLALMAGVGLPHEAIREQLGRGLDLVIHLARLSDGSRRVVEVAEVVRTAGSVGVRELYRLGGEAEGRPWAARALIVADGARGWPRGSRGPRRPESRLPECWAGCARRSRRCGEPRRRATRRAPTSSGASPCSAAGRSRRRRS